MSVSDSDDEDDEDDEGSLYESITVTEEQTETETKTETGPTSSNLVTDSSGSTGTGMEIEVVDSPPPAPRPSPIRPKVHRRMSLRVLSLPKDKDNTTAANSNDTISKEKLAELLHIMKSFPIPPTVLHDSQQTTTNIIYNNKLTDTAVSIVSGLGKFGMGMGKFLTSTSTSLSTATSTPTPPPRQETLSGVYTISPAPQLQQCRAEWGGGG
jgi:hypothetical protein